MNRALPSSARRLIATLVLAGAEPRYTKAGKAEPKKRARLRPGAPAWISRGKERLPGLAGSGRRCRGIEEALFFPYRLATL
jgi:hypothetical protein